MGAIARPGMTPNPTDLSGNGATNQFGGAPATLQQMMIALGQLSGKSAARANLLFNEGDESLSHVTDYLSKIAGGDRNAIFQAVAPEVANVTDQYDAAYKTISERGPRGGGRTSTLARGRLSEASDIGKIIASARPAAMKQLQDLALNLIGQSGNQEDIALRGMSSAVGARQAKQQMDDSQWNMLGQSLGTLLGIYASGGFKK